jgi:hypothetical protein
MRVFSFGGGRQSTAALVLAAQGVIQFQEFLFCNVGDDSENPATLRYVREIATPYAVKNDIEIVELRKVRRDGSEDTLLDWTLRSTGSSVCIPVRSASGFPGSRSCTKRFKIDQIDAWLRRHGATAERPATVGIGISLDEFERAKTDDPRRPWEHKEYPLIDLRLSRSDCSRIIAAAGLPLPPKSSCWFCPFHRLSEWQAMKRDTPALFEQSIALEKILSERNIGAGRPPLFMTRRGVPLGQVVGDQSIMDFDEGSICESGYCMT